MNQLTLAERLKRLRKERKITQRELAKIANVTPSSVTQWESGTHGPKTTASDAMARHFRLPVIFFSSNPLPWSEFFSEANDQLAVIDSNIDLKPVPATRMLPVVSWVQAGNWTAMESFILQGNFEEYLPDIVDAGDRAFWLQVQGVSNEPAYMNGDYICVDPTVQIDELDTGDMVVVTCNGDATFKQLIVESNNSRYLKALNPDWQPKIMALNEDCHLVGVVVASYRSERRKKRRI